LDACAELDFDDHQAMETAFHSEFHQTAISRDQTTLIERSGLAVMIGRRERCIGNVPSRASLKLMIFIGCRDAPFDAEGVLATVGSVAAAAADVDVRIANETEYIVNIGTDGGTSVLPFCQMVWIGWCSSAAVAREVWRRIVDRLPAAGVTTGHAVRPLLATPVQVVPGGPDATNV